MGAFVSVKEFGAAGNGRANDAPAIQRALQAGVPKVFVPAGIYRIEKPLLIGSDTVLRLDDDAVIRLASGAGPRIGAEGFLITNRDHVSGNRNITLEGGVWDGNNPGNPRGPDGPSDSYTGVAVNFVNVKGLNLCKLVVSDPESFYIRLGEVSGFLVEDITLKAKHVRPNQDGVHIGGFCRDGTIRCIRGLGSSCPNDDMVALNANDDVTRAINLGMKEGPIRQIRVEDIAASEAYTFVRILSQDALIEDVSIQKIRGGCRYYALNMNRWRFPSGKGRIRGIRIKDVEVARRPSKPNFHAALIDVNLAVQDLEIIDFYRQEDNFPEIATLSICDGTYARVLLRGLSAGQRRALKSASTNGVTRKDISEANDDSCLETALAPNERLCLPFGGFSRLLLGGNNKPYAGDKDDGREKSQD